MSDWEDAPNEGWEDATHPILDEAKDFYNKAILKPLLAKGPSGVFQGAGEAGASMLAGIPAQITSGLSGLGSLMIGQGLDKSGSVVADVQKSNFGAGQYQPSSEQGKAVSDMAGKAFAYPGEKAGELGEKYGGNLGRLALQLPTDVAMNFLPIHVLGKGLKGEIPKEATKEPTSVADKLDALDKAKNSGWEDAPVPYDEANPAPWQDNQFKIADKQALAEQNAPTNELHQTELFDQPEMGRVANPYEAKLGDWRVDENGIPIKADLSMDVQNVENPLQKNLWGDELEQTRNPVGQNADLFDKNGQQEGIPLTQAIDSMPDLPWKSDRDVGINQLTGGIEPSGRLQSAINEATPSRIKKRGQSGAIDYTEVAKAIRGSMDKFNAAVENLGKINTRSFIPMTKDEMAAKAVPGAKPDLEGLISKPENADAVIPKILAEGKDGPSLIKSLQQGLELTGEKVNSGLMKYTSSWLQWADKKTDFSFNKYVKPTIKSINGIKSDINSLSSVLKREMFNDARYTPEELRSVGVSDKVIDAYQKLRANFDAVLDMQNKGRQLLGMDPIDAKQAYLASIRKGNYHLVIPNKEGRPVWAIQAESLRDAYKAVNWFKENLAKHSELDVASLKPSYRESNAATNLPKDVLGAYQELSQLIDPESPGAIAVKEAIRAANEKGGYNLYSQKNRFLAKRNVRGFEGDMPWLSEKENSNRLVNAQLDYLRNAYKWSYMQEALGQIKHVMADADIIKQQPNNTAMVKEVMNQQLGLAKSITKDAEDFVMHNMFGMSRQALREATHSLKAFTYLQQLGFNLRYAITTPLTALNSIGLGLREVGGKAVNPLTFSKALADGAAGILGDLSYEYGSGTLAPPMTKLGKEMLSRAEANGLVTKTMFNEGHTISDAPAPVKGLTNFTQATLSVPEKTQRLFTLMYFAHHLNDTGKFTSLDALYKRAEELTNMSATNFRASERPGIVNKLGAAGELAYTYKAPLFNYYHQLSMFARDAAAGKSALPLAGMLGMTAFLGGALAFPLVNELDSGFNLLKDMWSNVSPETYSKASGLGLKGTIITHLPKIAAYGAVSDAMGAQMNTGFSPDIFDLEHPLGSVAPVATELREQSSIANFMNRPSKDSFLQGVWANSSPLVRGQLETRLDNFKGPKTAQGQVYLKPGDIASKEADYVRTPDQEFKRSLGLRDLTEAKTKDLRYINSAEQARVNDAVKDNVKYMFQNMINGNQDQVTKFATEIMKLNPDSNTLNTAIQDKIKKYAFTPEQRDMMNTNVMQILMKEKRMLDATK